MDKCCLSHSKHDNQIVTASGAARKKQRKAWYWCKRWHLTGNTNLWKAAVCCSIRLNSWAKDSGELRKSFCGARCSSLNKEMRSSEKSAKTGLGWSFSRQIWENTDLTSQQRSLLPGYSEDLIVGFFPFLLFETAVSICSLQTIQAHFSYIFFFVVMFTFKHDAYLFSDVVTSTNVTFQTPLLKNVCWSSCLQKEKAAFKQIIHASYWGVLKKQQRHSAVIKSKGGIYYTRHALTNGPYFTWQ